ncbi:hypothetical protein [Spirilliplanes yamanashiensis]|nr:hypothetical protein [Spirilliplanes yamanashiensis]MDP9818698.1 hypothetical protein [Spirilliplanes yamanashiensis]
MTTEHTKRAPEAGPDDEAPFLTPRRLIRWAAVVGVGIVAVLACWQDPSYAQGASDKPGESEAMLRACGVAAVAGAAVATVRSRRARA